MQEIIDNAIEWSKSDGIDKLTLNQIERLENILSHPMESLFIDADSPTIVGDILKVFTLFTFDESNSEVDLLKILSSFSFDYDSDIFHIVGMYNQSVEYYYKFCEELLRIGRVNYFQHHYQ